MTVSPPPTAGLHSLLAPALAAPYTPPTPPPPESRSIFQRDGGEGQEREWICRGGQKG